MDNRLDKILEIDSELNKIQDLDLLLEKILYEARKVTNADAGSVYLVENNQLAIKHSHCETLQKKLQKGEKLITAFFKVPISDKSISGWVAANEEPLNIPDMYNIPVDRPYRFNQAFDKKSGYKTVSSLTFPLISNQGKVLGVLQLMNAQDEDGLVIPFNPGDEPFVTHFASVATVALQRAQLTRTLILRMIRMAGLRDPKETGAHVNRVGAYSVEIYEAWARQRKIPQNELVRMKDILRMASMLHDIGKVAIPDSVLKKPGKLDVDEYNIMKTHTLHGAEILIDQESITDTLAQQVALRHHENWDGSGYPGMVDILTGKILQEDENGKPRGLKGEEIPLFARIVSLADVFDALICKRAYKPAWSEEDVLKEMQKMSGSKFEPELVEIFMEIMPTIRNVRQRYPE
ncbi:MAG: HD domain-containing protein [Spirochaetaceae bacterium]|jgi:HD-GYP domain-containing protein (c-di-GMP phosphodiesterase class II)|nr:HD domain-containing protein [Spirochaetaceae bacterium]